jgi:DNA-binding NtrC family response regulator
VVENGLAILRDLGSRNGTTVDGVGVREAYLKNGSRIGLGKSEVLFRHGTTHVRVEASPRDRFGLLLGQSACMRKTFAKLERAAASSSTVLLTGETGTGKELAAESIHQESKRAGGPFVIVDCASIPNALLESELFGHEKGSFTGAFAPREGAFEAASGGTLFLDEIGDLESILQPKLLRALERREIKRVGANAYRPVDVRIVAGTNRDLKADVNASRFRADLYYRLAVLEISLPPLRQRVDDIAPLVLLLAKKAGASSAEITALADPSLLARLAEHAWPGNVRELRNYVERFLAHDDAAPGDPTLGATSLPADAPLRLARERAVRAFEREYAEAMLARHGNNVAAAARAAGVTRMNFYRLLWRSGLRADPSIP